MVTRERAGNAHLYALNRRHLAAPCVERLASLRIELVSRLRETIAHWDPAPRAASLFESAARDDAGTASDIDILVVRVADVDADEPTWRAQLMAIEAQTFEWTGNDTRVLEYGEHELRRTSRDPVVEAAVQEGTDLFGTLRRLVRSR